MRRRLAGVLVLAAVALVAAPAQSDPVGVGYGAFRTHFIEAYQAEGQSTEVWIQAGQSETLASSESGEEEEEGQDWSFACISLFHNATIDEACGEVTISADPLLETATLTANLESFACDYVNDPEHGPTFDDCRGSQITLALEFTGSSDLRNGHSERSGIITCGLAPDIRGGGAQQEIVLLRDATVGGSLESDALGSIDPSILDARVAGSTMAYGVGCLNI